MNASLRRGANRAQPNGHGLSPPSAKPQPRAKLMSRFRANPTLPKNRSPSARSVAKEVEAKSLPDEVQNVASVELVQIPPSLSHSTEVFPFETGVNVDHLDHFLQRSLFGQDPSIVNPEGASLQNLLGDPALRLGILALASLGRDLDQEMRASRLCLKLKGQTIKAVRQRLAEDPSDISVGTIGAVATLAAFDLLECLGRPEPRPDNMNFLQLAVSRKGGLQGLAKDVCSQCSMLKRIILWLDLSFSVMDETPTHFAFYNSPTHLSSTALHNVSLHMTPLRMVFAELSELSRSSDEVSSTDSSRRGIGRTRLEDPVIGIEQYVTSLSTTEIAPDVLEILRLATFLYSARYVRRFSSNSRMQMQLAVRLQTCLDAHFKNDVDVEEIERGFQMGRPYLNLTYQSIVLWSATVAAGSCGSFKEISGRDHNERRSFWTDMIINIVQNFDLGTIAEIEAVLGKLTHDTNACRRDRRLLLKACGVPEF